MKYPIVEVKTEDEIVLHGLLRESPRSRKIVINIHGSASNFYEEPFIKEMATIFPEEGFSFLSTNNRGNAVLTHTWQRCGSAIEKFEDCLKDIDAWVAYALEKEYSTIILQGHSLGTEKIVYYMSKGAHRNEVSGIALLGFSDSYGNALKFMEKRHCKEELFNEARELVANHQGDRFLTSVWLSHAGILPKSAASFLNQFSEGSELSTALPLRLGKLDLYSAIDRPILAVISDNDESTDKGIVRDGSEHTILPVQEAAQLLEKSNNQTRAVIISDTGHDFEGKEQELTRVVSEFLKNHF